MNDVIASAAALSFVLPLIALISGGATPHERRLLWASAAAHVLSAGAMILLTREAWGGGDMFAYHEFGKYVAGLARNDLMGTAPHLLSLLSLRDDPVPFPNALVGSSTGAIQAAAAVLMYLLGDSLWGACVLIAGGACASKWLIYRVLSAELPHLRGTPLLISSLLVPSLVYWSSGLLKEPIALVGFGMLLHGMHQVAAQRRGRGVVLAVLGAVPVLIMKPYWLPPFGIAAATWQLARVLQRSGPKNPLRRAGAMVLTSGLALGLILATGTLFPEYDVETLEDEILRQQVLGTTVSGGSAYSLGGTTGLAAAPLSLFTALYRPSLIEARSVLMAVNSLETTAFLLLSLLAVLRRGPQGIIATLRRSPALLFALTFTLTFGVAVGMATTNLGTLSRYRLPLIPLFATLLGALVSAAPSQTSAPARSASATGRRWGRPSEARP